MTRLVVGFAGGGCNGGTQWLYRKDGTRIHGPDNVVRMIF